MQEADLAEPTVSGLETLVVSVPKMDGSLHFGLDYRRLNAEVLRYNCPISHMNKCIDLLGEVQMLSTIDANGVY